MDTMPAFWRMLAKYRQSKREEILPPVRQKTQNSKSFNELFSKPDYLNENGTPR